MTAALLRPLILLPLALALAGSIAACTPHTARMVDCVPGYHNVAGSGSRCVPDTSPPTSPPTQPPAGPVAPAVAPPGAHTSPRVGVPYRFVLLTHCGIDEARLGNVYLAADHPLSDQGNPPAGWANPSQRGTMTLLTPREAVFRDAGGHQVRFHAREGAVAFRHLCA